MKIIKRYFPTIRRKIIMKVKKSQSVITKGIVLNKNKSLVLLLKTKHGYWDLPGGHLEFGETPEQCLQREAKEEIDQELNIKGLSSIQTIILDGINTKKKTELRHYLVLIYNCEITKFDKKAVLQDKEIIKWKWFSLKQILAEEKNLPVLSVLKEQLLDGMKDDTIRTNNKAYLRMGEIKAYQEEKFKYE